MKRLSPLVIAVVGNAGAGKTTLIERLLGELNRRKYTVAVVKHCPHGFDLDVEGKDSWRFMQAGARGVSLASSGRVGLIEEKEPVPRLRSIAEHYFSSYDIVFGEGFKEEKEVSKILVLRKGVSEHVSYPQDDILALVSDIEIKAEKPALGGKPVFIPDNVPGIADFIEQLFNQEDSMETSVTLLINKKSVPLNPFVQSIFKNVIIGIIGDLKREDEELKQIEVIIKSEDANS